MLSWKIKFQNVALTANEKSAIKGGALPSDLGSTVVPVQAGNGLY